MDEDRELEFVREERKRALNPSSFDKGFGEGDDNSMGFGSDDDWGSFGSSDDGFGSSGGFGSLDNSFGSSDGFGGGFGSDSGSFGGGGFGGGGFGGGGFGGFGTQGQTGGQQQGQNDNKDIEDIVSDGIVKGGKAALDATKKIGASAKDFNVFSTRGMGKQLLATGGISTALGIILIFAKSSLTLDLIVGGLLSAGIGVIMFMLAHDKIEKNNLTEPVAPVPQQQTQQQNNDFGDLSGGFGGSSGGFGDSSGGFGDSSGGFGDSSGGFGDSSTSSDDGFGAVDSWGDDEDWGNFDSGSSSNDEGGTPEEPVESTLSGSADFTFSVDDFNVVDSNEVLNEVTIENGVVTRQYIYEKLCKVLPHANKDFCKIEDLDENSYEFGVWLKHLSKAVDVLKPDADSKEAKPQLISVKKKLFYYLLEISVKGVKGVKPDALTEQLVSLFAYDVKTNKRNSNVYGTFDSVGGVYYIKIMRGETATVSVEDIMVAEKDFFLNTKNEMPCALGIDIDGDPVLLDAATFDALLITGEPRSGKSWTTRSILLQMMAYSSPDDVNFYILDPKEGISDYKKMLAPHIRRFETTDEAVIDVLREVVKIEGPRRKQILAEAGVYKIQEFREKNPNTPFPYLYVVIDEVVTLSGRMDKDTKAEFQGLLTELVTQLPATGIRLFMIPHVVKDDIIKKTTTQNIPCRISVRGNAEHIELCTGLKPKEFQYKLTNIGDMAANIKTKDGVIQTFVHSAVAATSAEKTDEVFDFVDSLWRKINNIPADALLRVTKGGSMRTVTAPTVGTASQADKKAFAPIQTDNRGTVKSNNTSNNFVPVTNTTVTNNVPETFSYNSASENVTDVDDEEDLNIW